MKNKYFFNLLFLLISSVVVGQTYTMSNGANGTFSTCSGTFVDGGGSGANYANTQSSTITFCPSTPGDKIRVRFTSFNTESNGVTCSDYLEVWHANAVGAVGTQDERFCGTPGIFTVTSMSADGCVSFKFTSDNVTARAGWVATVSCVTPCVTPVAALVNASPVNICPGTSLAPGSLTVPFDASNSTTSSGSLVRYEWDWGDGTTNITATPTTTHTFPGTGGLYLVRLIVRNNNTAFDPLGCGSTNSVTRAISVMPEPKFTGTTTSPINITCGNSATLNGLAVSQTISQRTPLVSSTPIKLPDGTGAVYTSTLDFSGFFPAGSKMTPGCYPTLNFNLEHAWAYDLQIVLVSPSGHSVMVYNRNIPPNPNFPAGFGTCANSANNAIPGCPAPYSVVNTGGASWTTPASTTTTSTTCSLYAGPCRSFNFSYFIPQTYTSINSFSTLDGASLNGVWKLVFKDNASLDDGFLAGWSLDFPTSCYSPLQTITPDLTTAVWSTSGSGPAVPANVATSTVVNNPGPGACPAPGACVGNQLANNVTVGPFTSAGSYIYSFTVTDEFGCQYLRNVTVNVAADNAVGVASSSPVLCANTIMSNVTHTTTGGTGISNSGVSGANGLPAGVSTTWAANVITISGTPTVSGTFNYSIPLTGGCGTANATGTIIVNPTPAIPTVTTTAATCSANGTASVSNYDGTLTYTSTPTGLSVDTSGVVSGFTCGTPYMITATNAATCSATSASFSVECQLVSPVSVVTLTSSVGTDAQTVCVNVSITNITYSITNATDASVTGLPAGVTGSYVSGVFTISGTPTAAGTFNYTITTVGGCIPTTTTGTILVNPIITPAFTQIAPICVGDALAPLPTTSNNGITGTWSPAISNATTTTYTFTPNSGICVQPAQMTIIVNPVIGVTVNSSTVCEGTQATVTATPAIAGIYNYAWTVPAGVTNPGNVASFTTTTAGTYTVVLSQTNSFCNSGFDTEVGIPPLGMSYIHESNFPCWDTTATDGLIEVWATGRQGIFSYSGIQFVELNANQVSTLYQDLTVVPGTSASISFAHRGRTTGTDVMQVEIGPVGGPYLSLGQFSATPSAWVYNTIPYVFPINGGTNYTIRFVSVSSGSGFLTYGNFIDAVSVTGLSCPSLPASGTVTVTPLPIITLTSATTTTNQTVCQNVAIDNITYNITNATDATVTGLPTGITGSYVSGVFTISGTPTVSGTFNYTVTTSGGCAPDATTTGTITVTPVSAIALTSAVGTDAQTVCQNTAIADIIYSINNATGATVSGLPTGVSGTYASGVFTISGMPTVSGIFNYTVITTGGCVPDATVSGTITVTGLPMIMLTSATSTTTQTLCQNVSVSNITYSITNATGATVVGLPTGVTGVFTSGIFTISGTPTEPGIFNYTVTTTGGCSPDAATTGTITVSPDSAIILTSTVGTETQTVCENVSIANITYNIANATGATVSGLPVGVTGSYVSGVFTISGTPTAVGTFNYTVTTFGGCAPDAMTTGSILVNPIITPTFTQVAPVCSGTTLSVLPTTSNNGITGVWSPVLNNTATTTYTFTPNTGECAISTTMTIIVAPKPVLTYTVTNPICNESTLDFVLNSNVPGTTYTWTASNSGISGFIASGNETNINQLVQLIDPMSTSGSISMVISPIANGCVGDPISITILVKPNPKVTSITQQDATLCTGEILHMDVTGEPSGLTYNWTAVNNNGVLITSGVYSGTTTGAIDLQLATTNPTAVGTIQFEITPFRNGCYGTPVLSDVITVNPIPGNPIGLPQPAICSGESTTINVSENLHITGTVLHWEVIASSNVTGFTQSGDSAPGVSLSINDILFNSSNIQGFVTYRITSVLGECEGSYTDITVLVNPLPKPVLTDGHICVNATTGVTYQGYILDTQLSDPNFTYDWFLFNTTTNTYDPIAGASASTYEAMEAGNYQVIVTNSITNCTGEASADVIEVFPATAFTATVSDAFTDSPTITVSVNPIGTGSLIYALDGGAWQQSNVFTGVEAGTHTVLVSDLEGCTNLTIEVIVIDYPKFFTPNGDGFHDTWNIIGLNQADAKLYIFDRYGKLIKQISTTDQSKGWDGTYNGQQAPSTDYWFTLDYTENNQQKQFKSHFSLKR